MDGRNGVVTREAGPGRLGQRRVDQGKASRPEGRGTNRSSWTGGFWQTGAARRPGGRGMVGVD